MPVNTLEYTNPDQACFFMNLFKKAEAALEKEDYIFVCTGDVPDSEDNLRLQNLEMVRLGFEFGRMYERLGVLV